jgi:membrane protease YdiL (CAAX protease family)
LLALLVGPGLLSLGLIAACGNQAFERRARGEAYAGPSPFLVFGTVVAITFFVAFVVGLLLVATIGDETDVSAPVGELVSGLLTAAIFIGTVRLTVVGTGALSWAEMQVRRFDRRAVDDLAFGAALAAPVIVVTVLLAAVLAVLIPVTPTSPLPPTGTIGGLLLQLLVGAVIAPVSEEILFRGFSLTAWERSIGSQRAIVRASLLFALAHVINASGDSLGEVAGLIVVGMATRLPVAFVLGWVFVRRRSIWASIGLHSAFNAILLVLAHLAFTTAGT